jgi:hypothetical protein
MVPSPSVREVPLPRPLLGVASMLPVEAGRRERDHRATAPGGEVERKSELRLSFVTREGVMVRSRTMKDSGAG